MVEWKSNTCNCKDKAMLKRTIVLIIVVASVLWLLTHQHHPATCHWSDSDLVLQEHHTNTPGVVCDPQ